MVKNWAIAIGINRYDFLPRLHYAKQDAQSIETFLRTQAGFERIFFFSDDSPPVNGKSTQPSRANLLRMFRQVFETPFMGAGDNFWFFFSGHGMRYQEQDYLLPADGDPEDVENTAISIQFIADRLRRCGADNIVLILDACRNQSTRDGRAIGDQTAEIARQIGVVSIFSCSPNECSYEIEALQQGVFTHALLQGLGAEGHCATVESLDRYLTQRVPELSQQYGKPRQTPYTVAEPLSKRHLILLPYHATPADVATLKNDAYRAAQITGNLELSEQLWIRVLAASSGQDMEAIQALQRIGQIRMEDSRMAGTPAPPDSATVTVLTPPTPATAKLAQPQDDSFQGTEPSSLTARWRSLPKFQFFASGFSWAQKSVQILTGHTADVQTIVIHPNGRLLASGSHDHTVRLWDVQTGALLQTFYGHTNLVTVVAFSPTGTLLASGSGDNTIRLWDYQTGELVKTLTGHSGWVLAIALSADGSILASGSADGSIKIWELETYQECGTLTGHLGWVSSLAFSPDGRYLISGSHDHTIKLWCLETGELLDTLTGHTDLISGIAVSANGKTLVSVSQDHTLKLWHLKHGKLLRTLSKPRNSQTSTEQPLQKIALSPNGKVLASSRKQTIELWHLDRGKRVRTLAGYSDWVRAITFKADGTLLVSGNRNQTIWVWQTCLDPIGRKIWLALVIVLFGLGSLHVYQQFEADCRSRAPSLAVCLSQHPWMQTIRERWFTP